MVVGKMPEEIELFIFWFFLRHASGGFNGDPAHPGTGPHLGSLVIGADLAEPPQIEGGADCAEFRPLDDDLLLARSNGDHLRLAREVLPAFQL